MTQRRDALMRRSATGPAELTHATRAVDALRMALGDALVAAVLFGSRARGDAHDHSDWDILVIAEGLPDRPFARHLFLKRLLPSDCRGAVSIVARTPDEFESSLAALYLDIALDGRILYDPQRYATERLALVQRIIHTKGLYRERTQDGDVWRWKTAPPDPWQLAWET